MDLGRQSCCFLQSLLLLLIFTFQPWLGGNGAGEELHLEAIQMNRHNGKSSWQLFLISPSHPHP